ncbi:hypothetical protein CRG98_021475 [Punica granatum]|uniref:Uncharacterized protein n=1 Tax=Punica granatum TaxID=22663 RepID=A0A2I0JPD7_PUNGR|nr:hypothetical protein CRG98_021475 [Punica granatum]
MKLARVSDLARLQEARARWHYELGVQENKLVRVSRPGRVRRGTSEVDRRTCGAGKYSLTGCKRHERGGSVNLRCKKVNSNELADPERLLEARARWLGELAVQEMNLARVRRPGKVARVTSEEARRTCGAGKQGCKRHERGGSANLRCKKVNSNGLADPARLQVARARWLGELAVQEMKLSRVSDLARLQEARARWLYELAVQESKLVRVSRPGTVGRGTSEVARRTCGAGK